MHIYKHTQINWVLSSLIHWHNKQHALVIDKQVLVHLPSNLCWTCQAINDGNNKRVLRYMYWNNHHKVCQYLSFSTIFKHFLPQFLLSQYCALYLRQGKLSSEFQLDSVDSVLSFGAKQCCWFLQLSWVSCFSQQNL